MMEVLPTSLQDVKIVRPKKHGDERGWFAELFNERAFAAAGLSHRFVQDNQSFSRRGVLRGLHYQVGEPQGKLVRVLEGHIWDVAVDLRLGSPDYGRWAGFDLTGEQTEYVWIPEGFAHGFLVLSETASVLYKTTRYYAPAAERCVRWDDPTLAIAWPLYDASGNAIGTPSISAKDAQGGPFLGAEPAAPYRRDLKAASAAEPTPQP
jgi:dTDP-4-dehydrorhamnose 3,5-epimerase